MARTKASVGAKVSAGKSNKARCSVAAGPSRAASSRTEGGGGSRAAGNAVCARDTPLWQRPITSFFTHPTLAACATTPTADEVSSVAAAEAEGAARGGSSSKNKHRRNVIESDEEVIVELPKNNELEESIHLEPLNGENSHKLDEYYPRTGDKGKGVGKKTKGKENVNVNEPNHKREREESLEESVSKKVKIQ